MFTIENISLNDLDKAATEFIGKTRGYSKFAFYGKMGAGKTTFIKALCLQLGVKDTVNSPTFTLVNEYQANGNKLVYHFDFYRIEKIEELYDIGYEDYFFSPNYLFIEWPEKAEEIIPDDTIRVDIEEISDRKRLITVHLNR